MKLKPINADTVIYARPNGWHYHLDRECPMLSGDDFERLKYEVIKQKDIKKRGLRPCMCAYDDSENRQITNRRKVSNDPRPSKDTT